MMKPYFYLIIKPARRSTNDFPDRQISTFVRIFSYFFKRKIFCRTLYILFVTISLFALNANPTRAELKPLIGAQISVLEANNIQGCENYFKNLKNLGYNCIILRVFHNRGDRFHHLAQKSGRKLKPEGVYFTTSQVPVIADILTPVCDCAHRCNLKIYAWMNTLKADYSHKLKHKVLTYNQKTGQIEPEKNLLDPDDPENINFLEHLFADLATHPIDGILLQDDLMLRHNQGFKLLNHKPFPLPAKIYELNPQNPTRIESYKPDFKQWRRQQALLLRSLANRIFAAARRLKPQLICAQNIHYEILYNPAWGRDWFAWTKTALAGSTADYLMIMSYQERVRKELELNSDNELAVTMDKIFTNALQWQDQKAETVFKFTTPPSFIPLTQKRKLLTTLNKIIALAHRKNWHNLVLTPCNNLNAAGSINFRKLQPKR